MKITRKAVSAGTRVTIARNTNEGAKYYSIGDGGGGGGVSVSTNKLQYWMPKKNSTSHQVNHGCKRNGTV